MKKLLTLSLSLFAFSVFAQGDLMTLKRDATNNIDQKISTLESSRACINSATSVEKFKACKYDMFQDMKMQKEEARDSMKEGQGSLDKAGSKVIESKKTIETETFEE